MKSSTNLENRVTRIEAVTPPPPPPPSLDLSRVSLDQVRRFHDLLRMERTTRALTSEELVELQGIRAAVTI